MRTTEKQLNDLVKHICDLTNMSNNRVNAIANKQESYLALENATCYGGWRLIKINVITGAHYGAFNSNGTEPRIKAKEMEIKLRGIIAGLEFKK